MSEILKDFNGFFSGVVEDNNDPLKMGRCRIRVLGIHTPLKQQGDTEGIPTDHLPWAEQASPIPLNSGWGLSSIPEQGTWVWVFFDGADPWKPVYFAGRPGVNNSPINTAEGFNDPDGMFPTSEYKGESDVNKLARGEVVGRTIVHSEPETEAAPEYPNNHVLQIGDHLVEIDNTVGKERIRIKHMSGTETEIFPDGRKVDLIIGNNYRIVKDGETVYVQADRDVTIQGSHKEDIAGDETRNVQGSRKEDIGGTLVIEVSGNATIKAPTVTLDGNAVVTGKLTVTKSMTADGGRMKSDGGNLEVSGTLKASRGDHGHPHSDIDSHGH